MNRSWRITATCAALLVLQLAPGAGRAQQQDDRAYLQALGALYSLDLLGGLVKSWCDERVPQGEPAHAAGFAAWRKKFSLDQIEARFTAALGAGGTDTIAASIEQKRAGIYAKLDKDMKNPSAVCAKLEAKLSADFNPKNLYPEQYKIAFAQPAAEAAPAKSEPEQSPTPADPPPQQSEQEENSAPEAERPSVPNAPSDWGLLKPQRVEAVLKPAGARGPLTLGGKLKLGAYHCTQVRDYSENRSMRSTYRYTLDLHEDEGMRVDAMTLESDTFSKPVKIRGHIGTYAYDAATGELNAASSKRPNAPFDEFKMWNGIYKSPIGEPPVATAFRFVIDAQGKAYIYGQQQLLPPKSTTACAYASDTTKQASPVAEAKSKRAETDAARYRYRTKPGLGLKPEQIEGYLHTQRSYTDVAGSRQIEEDSDLLLKDGWGYSTPDFTPHDFDAKASRKHEPLRWFRWKRDGASIVITDDGNNWDDSKGTIGKAVPPAQLNGALRTMKGISTGVGQIQTTYTQTWIFENGKQFAYLSSKKIGLSISSSKDEGTYSLDGYTLALTYQDGTVARRYVYTLGEGGKSIVIGGQTYSRK
jgi:hypothetical protein